MARLVTSGLELQEVTGATTAPDGSAFQTAVETSIIRSGAASRKLTNNGSGMGSVTWDLPALVALGTDLFLRTYIYVPTGGLPSTGTSFNVFQILNVTSTVLMYSVRLDETGALQLWTNSGTTAQQGSSSSPISLDTWQRVEMRGRIATGALDACELQLEGVQVAVATGLTVTDTQIGRFTIGGANGTPTVAGVMYVDDVAANDSTGAAQTSWPGDAKVVLLRPTADSAVGTGWTLGNTTATGGNAWSRLNKAPPDSATDLTTAADADQIRNATSNANVNYDATMTTYTAAGMGASDTVNVVVPIIATGAPVVTSAKAGTVGVVSNPAITNISLGAGGTSGAFWSGVAVGAYPTGNKWSFGTTTYAPTVTLGTAPVMRVTQVTASTRIAIVTEMGIYVDYTPAVIIPPTPLVHQSVPFYPRPSSPS